MDKERQKILESRTSTTLFGSPKQGKGVVFLTLPAIKQAANKDMEAAHLLRMSAKNPVMAAIDFAKATKDIGITANTPTAPTGRQVAHPSKAPPPASAPQ